MVPRGTGMLSRYRHQLDTSTLTTLPGNVPLLQAEMTMVVVKITTFSLLAALRMVVVKTADGRGIVDG